MVPALVFFAIATLVGCAIGGVVRLRLRAAARQPDVTDADVCQLQQANRISTVAVLASLAGLAAVAVVYVVL